jgi:hypothetical protein
MSITCSLLLSQDLVDLVVELDRRLEVVPEGLLDHDPCALGAARAAELLDHRREDRRRDLEIEDGMLGVANRLLDPVVGVPLHVVALDVGELLAEGREDVVVNLGASGGGARLDRLAGMLAQVVIGPFRATDPDNRDLQGAVLAQVVEGFERHLPGQVAGDPEDHQRAGGGLLST